MVKIVSIFESLKETFMEINETQILSFDNSIYRIYEYVVSYFHWPRHYHSEVELMYINEGYGKLYAGDLVIDFKKGDLFLIAPNMSHAFKNSASCPENNDAKKLTGVFFQLDFLGENFLFKKETQRLYELFKKMDKGVLYFVPGENVVQHITDLLNAEGLEGICILLKILNILAQDSNAEIISDQTAPRKYYIKHSTNSKLQDVINYVQRHFDQDISSAKVAKIVNMSGPAFSRFIKLRTNKTFSDALNEIRILHARNLLLETDKNTTDISKACGYNNVSHFNRQFRKFSNMSPAEFRRGAAVIQE